MNNSSNHPVYLATLIWLALVAALVGNIQPMFLGSLAETFQLQARELGLIGGAELAGSCLASLTAPLWFSRVRLRWLAAIAMVVGVVGNLATAFVEGFSALLIMRFTIGLLASGVLYAIALGLVGRTPHPDRLIAIAIVCQVLSLSVGLAVVPRIQQLWQFWGVGVALATMFASCLLLLRWLPPTLACDADAAPRARRVQWLPAGLMLGLILFSCAVGGLWAFLERIGSALGFASADIGAALALSGLLGGGGALVAAVIDTRLGRVMPIVFAVSLAMVACLVFIFSEGWRPYVIAAAAFNFSWNLTLPYLMGAIAVADTRSQFMVLVPAAQTGGYAAGAALTGTVVAAFDLGAVAWQALLFFVLSLLVILPLLYRLIRSTTTIEEN